MIREPTTEEKPVVHVIPGEGIQLLEPHGAADEQLLVEDHIRDLLSRVDVEVGFLMYVGDKRSKNHVLGGARVRYPVAVDMLREEAMRVLATGELQVDHGEEGSVIFLAGRRHTNGDLLLPFGRCD